MFFLKGLKVASKHFLMTFCFLFPPPIFDVCANGQRTVNTSGIWLGWAQVFGGSLYLESDCSEVPSCLPPSILISNLSIFPFHVLALPVCVMSVCAVWSVCAGWFQGWNGTPHSSYTAQREKASQFKTSAEEILLCYLLYCRDNWLEKQLALAGPCAGRHN